MDSPIIIRFPFTIDEALTGFQLHDCHGGGFMRRQVARILSGGLDVGGIAVAFRPHLMFMGMIAIMFSCMFFGLCGSGLRRSFFLKQVAESPVAGSDIEYDALDDRLVTKTPGSYSETYWSRFVKLIVVPGGVLLYRDGGNYDWLPRHGFANEIDYEHFLDLARSRIENAIQVN
ncbi:MAG: YcxB family protein [Planctomycetaceae bacterium]